LKKWSDSFFKFYFKKIKIEEKKSPMAAEGPGRGRYLVARSKLQAVSPPSTNSGQKCRHDRPAMAQKCHVENKFDILLSLFGAYKTRREIETDVLGWHDYK
jgi:hypothetical protein